MSRGLLASPLRLVWALSGSLIVTIGGSVLGSTLTTISLLLNQMSNMGRDVSDARERPARIEGHLMAPEGFRMRGPHAPAPDEPSPEGPDPDHRQTG